MVAQQDCDTMAGIQTTTAGDATSRALVQGTSPNQSNAGAIQLEQDHVSSSDWKQVTTINDYT